MIKSKYYRDAYVYNFPGFYFYIKKILHSGAYACDIFTICLWKFATSIFEF